MSEARRRFLAQANKAGAPPTTILAGSMEPAPAPHSSVPLSEDTTFDVSAFKTHVLINVGEETFVVTPTVAQKIAAALLLVSNAAENVYEEEE